MSSPVMLSGLAGVAGDKPARHVRTANVMRALRACGAATASADNGAVTVWRDDEGKYRCDRQHLMSSKEAQTLDHLKDVRAWVKAALEKIQ